MTWKRLCLLVLTGMILMGRMENVKAQAISRPWSPYTVPNYATAPLGTETTAFYYPWYCGSNWDGRLLQMNPALGRYDNRQTQTMNSHMAWAQQAGLSSLIVSWWGRNDTRGQQIEQLMPALLNTAANYNIRLLFMIELYPGRTPQSVADDIRQCIAHYQGYSAWYTSTQPTPYLDARAKPVFFIDKPDNGQSLTWADWLSAVQTIHADSQSVVLAHSFDTNFVTLGNFDGLWDYSYTNTWDVLNSATRLPDNAWYVPTTCPGFDARRSKNWAKVIPRSNGAYYASTWNKVLQSNIITPMVSVTSFNEWFETTQIEPCTSGRDSDGFVYETYAPGVAASYLDLTAYWADRLSKTPIVDVRGASEVALRLNAVNTSYGLYQYDWGSDGNTETGTIGGKPARRSLSSGNNRYLYLMASKKFLPSSMLPTHLQVRVDYFDSGTGDIYVNYNGVVSASQTSAKVRLTNTNAWRTALIDLPDALLTGRMNGYSDIRLTATTGVHPWFNLIVLKKLP